MELQIISKNELKITDEVKQYIQKKIDKLNRHFPDMVNAKIEILQEKTKSRQDSFIVQATLIHRGTLLRGEERGVNIQAAADAVADVLERQIERYKGKFQRKAKGAATVRQSAVPVEELSVKEKAELSPRVSKTKRFVVDRVSVDEAIDQMELLNHDFFLFVNNENSVLSLLYRRKDGNYGVIEPEIAP